MKEYCRYAVIEIETGNVLIIGNKIKDFSEQVPESEFRAFPRFWRKVREYGKIKIIKGRACYIVYWTGERAKGIGSCILLGGRKMALRGSGYTNEHINFMPFLRVSGMA